MMHSRKTFETQRGSSTLLFVLPSGFPSYYFTFGNTFEHYPVLSLTGIINVQHSATVSKVAKLHPTFYYCHSVPGNKHPRTLKHNPRFWPARVLNYPGYKLRTFVYIEAAILTQYMGTYPEHCGT